MSRGIPRPMEAAVAAIGLAICAPLLLVLALGVRLTSPGPALFRQQRVGRNGVPFTLLKLRTMRAGGAGRQVTAAGDPRITSIGKWLRLLKFDELPALWNVVRGDLSLVGPRPEVPAYVDVTSPAWAEVLSVRPGITDPVTLELRHEESLMASVPGDPDRFYREVLQPYKLARYREYLRRRTVRTDVAVLISTVAAVVAPSSVPVPPLEEIQRKVSEP